MNKFVELSKGWIGNQKLFLEEDSVPYTLDTFGKMVQNLNTNTRYPLTILIEADNSLKTYVKFITLMNEGHTVMLVPSYQFHDQNFLKLVHNEIQTDFSIWPFASEIVPYSAKWNKCHPVISEYQSANKPLFIVRTSGSSGKKYKFVLHDPEKFILKYQLRGKHFDKTLAFSPAESIAGIETFLEALVYNSALVVSGDKLTPEGVTHIIECYGIDYFQTTPTFLNLMLISGQIKKENLKSLKKIAFGSEPPLAGMLEKISGIKPEIQLIHTYGMTEIGIQKTMTRKKNPNLIQLDRNFNEGRINEGIVEVKSKTPMLCYLNVSDKPFMNDWFITGDFAEIHDDFWKILGRSGDLINLAGRKFFPSEVEDLYMKMYGVLDVSVHKDEHELIGTILIAKFSIIKDLSETEFRLGFKKFSEENVPAFMRPNRITITQNPLPNLRFKKSRVL